MESDMTGNDSSRNERIQVTVCFEILISDYIDQKCCTMRGVRCVLILFL